MDSLEQAREALTIAQRALYNTCLVFHNQGKNDGDDPNYDTASDALRVLNDTLAALSRPVEGVKGEPVETIPKLTNAGRYLAEGNDGTWHYLNHAGTWQGFQGPAAPPVADSEALRERVTPLQARVQPWMLACFGPEISGDKLERSDRFIEEALELVQAVGYDRERVLALVDYVYSRVAGDPPQEVGGVMITLAAFCLAHDLNMHECGETELARIWTKVEKIRAKQAAKPTGSALPVAAEARLAQAERGPAVTEAMVEAALNAAPHPGSDVTVSEILASAGAGTHTMRAALEAALHPQSAAGEEGKP